MSLTQYGFRWGPLEVTRLMHVEGRGYVLEVKTEHQSMQVYVTEKGRKIEAMAPNPAARPSGRPLDGGNPGSPQPTPHNHQPHHSHPEENL